jgi:hypothetical protein
VNLDPKLAAALVAAQKAIKPVQHDRENTFHRYRYASSEAIIQAAREALLSASLAVVMTGWELDGEQAVKVGFALIHDTGASAEFSVTAPALVEKGRPLDKAVSGALTLAESYFLRGLLLIPRVAESDDVAARDDTKFEPAQPSTKPAEAAPTERLVTLDERKAMTVAAKRHGVSVDEVRSFCQHTFGKPEPRLLTSIEMRSLIAWVELVDPPAKEGEAA